MFAELYDLKNFMGFQDVASEDNALTLTLEASFAYIQSYCNRQFISTRRADYVDPIDSYTILVPDFPLTAVHGITYFAFETDTVGIALPIANVKFYKMGKIIDIYGDFDITFAKSVYVEYTAGYTNTDRDWNTLKWLQLEIAAQLFRNRGTSNLASVDTGGAVVKKFEPSSDAATALMGLEVLAALNLYVRRGPRDVI